MHVILHTLADLHISPELCTVGAPVGETFSRRVHNNAAQKDAKDCELQARASHPILPIDRDSRH